MRLFNLLILLGTFSCLAISCDSVKESLNLAEDKDGKKDEVEKTEENTEEIEDTDPIVLDNLDLYKANLSKPLPPQRLEGELKKPATCETAELHIKKLMLEQIRLQFVQEVEWRKRYEDMLDGAQPASSNSPEVLADTDSAGAQESKSAESSEPEDFTTTNNQVEGVEEADFIKNTGTHIYVVHSNKLEVIKSWPAADMKSLASIQLKDKPFQMLLDSDNNRLVLASYPQIKDAITQEQIDRASQDIAYYPLWRPRYDYNSVRITVYDVSNPEAISLSQKYLLQGYRVALRRIGSSIRLVLSNYMGYPKGVKTYLDWYGNRLSVAQVEEAYNKLLKENGEIILNTSLEELISYNRSYYGFYELDDEEGRVEAIKDGDCSSIYIPTTPSQLGTTTVATINMDDKSVEQSILLTNSGQVYASKSSLYVSSPYWWYWGNGPEDTDSDYSYIHKFDLLDANKAGYLSSGRIPGRVLNQFSMDEHNDILRVAVTINKYEKRDDEIVTWWNNNTVNQVLTLKQDDTNKLEIIGQTKELAEGERIYSARFMQDRGFLVTFRQVDPLFTLDLSDPTNPAVVGELKIPGFSNYMQMISDNHILAVGQDADANGRTQGLKLSVFDVSDMAKPVESFNHVLSDLGYSSSEAQYDHKAFTYFRSKGLLGIPVTGYKADSNGYWWSRYISELRVFKIDLEKGISEIGNVNMNDVYTGNENDNRYWWYNHAQIKRSIFADDFVYALSNAGVRVVNIADFDTTVNTVEFTCDEFCYAGWWY